jgi:hypothetical protein
MHAMWLGEITIRQSQVQSGFSGSIALACSVSGPSPMPTCGISPVSVPPGKRDTHIDCGGVDGRGDIVTL